VLNHKRAHLRELEERFRITITITADATMGGQTPFVIERGEQVHTVEQARAIAAALPALAPPIEPEEEPLGAEEEAEEDEFEDEETSEGEESGDAMEAETRDAGDREPGERDGGERDGGERDAGETADGVRRRRRRRRRGRRGEPREGAGFEAAPGHASAPEDHPFADDDESGAAAEPRAGEPRESQPHGNGGGESNAEGELRRRRRRGRRGGRRNRRDRDGEERIGPDSAQGFGEHGPAEHDAMEQGTVAPRAIEPELANAVADFGGPPAVRERNEPAAPREPDFARNGPPASEPPRRRSTVREPVPFPIEDEAAQYSSPAPSAPQPVTRPADAPQASDPSQDDDGKPRRTGWWGKRLLGG
jgi:ribonuclease E